jgi:hypothetical protein
MENFEEIYDQFVDTYDHKYSVDRHKYLKEDQITEEINIDIDRINKQKEENMKYLYELYCACYNYNQILCSFVSSVRLQGLNLLKKKLEVKKKEIKDLLLKIFLNYDFEICKYNTSVRLQGLLNIFNNYIDLTIDGVQQYTIKIEPVDRFIDINKFFTDLFAI